MAFITGTSNYPSDFDLNPSGSGTVSTLSFVLDEIRDSNGVVTQSGNKVVARDVNVGYTVINQLERVLGTNPQGSFDDVSGRLNFMQNSGNLAFVHITGDSMIGNLTFPSGSILILSDMVSSGLNWALSGNSTLSSTGTFTQTAGDYALYANTYYFNGSSFTVDSNSISLYSTLISISGSIEPIAGVTVNLGSSGVPFENLYVNNIFSTGGAALVGVVASSGGSMFGNLTMTGTASISFGSGSSITNTISGVNQIGDDTNPFGDVYTKTLHATNITGMSPINVLSDIEFGSGVTIGANSSGIIIGSVTNPIIAIYASDLIGVTGLDPDAVVQKSGSDVFGDITFSGNADIVLGSGSDIIPSISGVNNVGLSGTPMGDLYVDRINNRSQANLAFNEVLTGTVDGVNKQFFFANSPTSAMIFVSGSLILPSLQYLISGTSLYLTGSMYAPTTAPVAGFYIY